MNMQSENILALDQSLCHTGYALFSSYIPLDFFEIAPNSKNKQSQILFGEIQTDKVKKKIHYTDWERLHFISQCINNLCSKHKIDTVVFEQPFVRAHFKSALQLQQLYAVIQVELLNLQNPIKTITLSPRSWPKAIGVPSTKKPLLDLLEPYSVLTDHQSDAIGVGFAYLQQINIDNTKTKDRIIDVNNIVTKFEYISGEVFNLSKHTPLH